jgi:hypothetical protein
LAAVFDQAVLVLGEVVSEELHYYTHNILYLVDIILNRVDNDELILTDVQDHQQPVIPTIVQGNEHLLVVVEPDVALLDYPKHRFKVVGAMLKHALKLLVEVGVEGEGFI